MLLSKIVKTELSFLTKWTLLFDLVLYIATLPIYGFGVEVPAGIALGTFAMLLNFTILGITSERAADRGSDARRYMTTRYVLRMLLLGIFIYIAVVVEWFNIFAMAVPLFYPKLAYTIDAIRNYKKNNVIDIEKCVPYDWENERFENEPMPVKED